VAAIQEDSIHRKTSKAAGGISCTGSGISYADRGTFPQAAAPSQQVAAAFSR